MKHFVLAGVSDIDRAHLMQLIAAARRRLVHAWGPHDGSADIDLVIADLEQFAGRVARVRANDERKNLVILADADAPVTGASFVLRRPFDVDALAELFNRAVGAGPLAANDPSIRDREPAADEAQAKEPAPVSTRACFQKPREARICTNLDELLQRGPLSIERPGLPRLVLDPVNETYHANAPLSRLEPYFLDPLKSAECRTLTSARLQEMRASAPGRPLVQLRWMGAMLRSNGCLASHLDPGGTYRVQRWMPVYGEYRKQYRIATMMLRPSRLHEIARKADATMVEVFDVINAYDAIGLLEWQPRESRHDKAAAAAKAEAVEKAAERQRAASMQRRLLAAAFLTR